MLKHLLRFVWSVSLALALAGASAQAATYYVAPDGDDARDGLALPRAWRTVNHAAAQVRAGDTVLLAAGVYRESVRLRAGGAPDRPITFKAIPGHKVVFDGDARSLGYAFHASYQSHLRFDGFYFTGYSCLDHFHMPWSDRTPGNGYGSVFMFHGCRDIQVTRCFNDGRGLGYAGGIVTARNCTGLIVRNCVTVHAMGGGVDLMYCPDTLVEHCVFLEPMIYATVFQNHDNQPGALRRNIFTDNLRSKAHTGLLYNAGVRASGNCFFMRVEPSQRAWDKNGTLEQWMTSNAQAQQLEPAEAQMAIDPQFTGVSDMPAMDAKGNPWFPADYLMQKQTLEFADLFATNPAIVERDIGLQRQAFADMIPHATP